MQAGDRTDPKAVMRMLNLEIVKNYDELSDRAAAKVAALVKEKRDAVLGLATGATPEGMYARLVRMHRAEEVSFSSVTTFNLDEYESLPPGHPQSYHYYMHRHFFSHINISPQRINIPLCSGLSVEAFCLDYDSRIEAAGGIDLQILGIGSNGHVGFNEPANSLLLGTHLVELAEETIRDNSRHFDSPGDVPRRAITMGIGSIMQAGEIVLLASGKGKARAIADSLSGRVTTAVPASLLQLHPRVTFIIDKEAASIIEP